MRYIKKKLTVLIFLTLVSIISANQPNIIFIMADDLGKEWISSYGADDISTPQIDNLVQKGLKFNNAYSMPKCTPTRATLLTGTYPYQHGWIDHWDVPRWSPESGNGSKGGLAYFDWKYHITFGRIMRSLGYKTAAAGKWQINDFRRHPDAMVKHGFDEYCMWTGYEAGNPPSAERYWDPYIHTAGASQTYSGEYGPTMFTDFIIDFLGRNKNDPMMIYFPMVIPHGPMVSTPLEPGATGTLNRHKAMVRYMDHSVGRIANALDSLGIDSNTILIFTTDNGSGGGITGSRNGTTVRGGKGQQWERGINEPFVAYGPGIVPEGISTDELIDFTDMLPTFAELGGISPDTLNNYYTLHGKSFASLLLGDSQTSLRDWIMAMGGGVSVLGDSGVTSPTPYKSRVIQDGTYKVWINNSAVIDGIYNLIDDPFEQNNLINSSDAGVQAALVKFEALKNAMPSLDNRFVYEGALYETWPDSVADLPQSALPIEGKNISYSAFSKMLSFGPGGNLTLTLPNPAQVSLKIYELSGKKVSELHEGWLEKGEKVFRVNSLATGIYVIQFKIGNKNLVKRFNFI